MARSRRRTWLFASSGIASLALGACSLFVSVDDLQGGADGGANESGSGDGSIGSDARSDSNATDDGSIGDAGVDSCVFCDDFDDRTSGLGPWAQFSGGYDISSAEFRSAPHSVHFQLAASSSGNPGVSLSTPIMLPQNRLTIDFDVKVATDLSSAGGYFNILDMSLNGNYAGSITASSGNWGSDLWFDFPDGGHSQTFFGVGTAPDQNWHHFQYIATYDEVNGSFHVSFDGTSFGNVMSVQTYATSPGPGAVTISLGIGENPPLPAIDIYIDNVAVHY